MIPLALPTTALTPLGPVQLNLPETTLNLPGTPLLRLTHQARAAAYQSAHPKFAPLTATDRWLYGIWMIGNLYKRESAFYGAYPHSYLSRVMSLFPDKSRILHLFAATVPPGPYVRVDIDPTLRPDIAAHAAALPFAPGTFDLILADPPYSAKDAKHYGFPMVNRRKVLLECARILRPEGDLVWLDTMVPMYNRQTLHYWGVIGLICGSNRRVRLVSLFRKVQGGHQPDLG